jgi:hypothetical protein
MRNLTTAEALAFLTARPRSAKLATVRADGRPHVAPVWFALDGEVIVFTTWRTTVKAANLRRDPRVALCIDDDAPPLPLSSSRARPASPASLGRCDFGRLASPSAIWAASWERPTAGATPCPANGWFE